MESHINPGSCLSVTFLLVIVSLTFLASSAAKNDHVSVSVRYFIGDTNFGPLNIGIDNISAESPQPSTEKYNDSIVLASIRTNRPDILRKFKKYQGGWNISDHHYWSSVGFTGSPGFILAAVWLVCTVVALIACYCCRRQIHLIHKGSLCTRRVYLLLLILFTSSATTGCILLSIGQGRFHDESVHTLRYVVNQSDYTVQTLRNVTEYLKLAKTIKVAQLILPTESLNKIDKLNLDLTDAADTVAEKTHENSAKSMKVFHAVRSALISLASVMLFLALLGLIFSILEDNNVLYILALTGWLLVAITFILCGAFLVLGNAISDTCLAMEEWVANPQASSALSSILPCVDVGTTNKTLNQSKVVINNMVNLVNTYIYTYANTKKSKGDYGYYNQSGPSVPPLCYPFDSGLQARQCRPEEVSLQNATVVWEDNVCEVSTAGICVTAGRITPDIYRELVAALNESYALQYYTPLLLNLQNCKFVQDSFGVITSDFCPSLKHNLRLINVGLGLVPVGVSLCIVLWISNRPRREDEFVDKSFDSIHNSEPGLEAGGAKDGLTLNGI